MSTVLKRRLERIEAAAMPPPVKRIRMLFEPQAGASDAWMPAVARSRADQDTSQAWARSDIAPRFERCRPDLIGHSSHIHPMHCRALGR